MKFAVDPVHTFQKYKLEIDDDDDKTFQLKFKTDTAYMPKFSPPNYDDKPLTSRSIKNSYTEAQFGVAVRDIFNRISYPAGNTLKITKTVAGTKTTFDFELRIPFKAPLLTQMAVTNKQNNGTITPTLWSGAATDPVGGKFIVEINDNGSKVDTEEYGFDWGSDGLSRAIVEKLPKLKGKLFMTRDYDTRFPDARSGSDFVYKVQGLTGITLKAKNAVTTPLTGGRLGTGNNTNPSFTSGNFNTASNNIVYKSIPAQYLRTYHKDSPQTVVTIDGVPAACPNRNCEFKFIANAGQITNAQYNAGTKVVTITGTGLPTGADLTGVSIGTYTSTRDTIRDCAILSGGSATSITCKLSAPIGGTYVVDVHSTKGAVAHSTNPKKTISINHVVTSFSPATVSSSGGDLLTIVGDFFADDLAEANRLNAAVKIGSAVCVLRTWTRVMITC